MDFFDTVNELENKEEARAFYSQLVRNSEDAVEFAATKPERFCNAMLLLRSLAGHGFGKKTDDLQKMIEGRALLIREEVERKAPREYVHDCLSIRPPAYEVSDQVYSQLRVPAGFVLNDRGIFRVISKEYEDVEVSVIPDPILLTSTHQAASGGVRYISLLFRDLTMRWQSLNITLEDIGSPVKLLALARFGLAINNDNRQNVMQYLTKFWEDNRNALPMIETVSSLGWTDEDRPRWVTPDKVLAVGSYGSDIKFVPPEGFESRAEGFSVKGEWKDWLRTWEYVRKYPIPVLAIGHALASPMLKLLPAKYEVHPVIMDIGAEPGSGKSETGFIFASVFGKPGDEPDSAGTNWNNTPLYLQNTFGVFGTMPILIDETKHLLTLYGSNRDKAISSACQVIYAIHAGSAKGGMTKSGAGRQVSTWCMNALSTGEETLYRQINGHEGAMARLIPIQYRPFGRHSEEAKHDIREIKGLLAESHGVIGEAWVKMLMQLWADADWKSPAIIETMYGTALAEIEALAINSYGTRIAKSLAAAHVAIELCCDFLGMSRPKEPTMTLIRQIMKDINYQSNRSDNVLRDIISYLMHNPGNVVGLGAGDTSQIWAAWPEKGKAHVTISEQFLKQYFKSHGLSWRIIVKDWLKNGYFLFDVDAEYTENDFDAWLQTAKTTEIRRLYTGSRRTIHGFKFNVSYFRDIIARESVEVVHVPTEEEIRDTPAPQERPKLTLPAW